ncbi:MAG TPA: VOC family protein, partial [Solirubrobacteraceae bacterium]
MKPLGGPHHFTGVTADVKTNVDFWCRVMGLRFVKNTLNYETTFRYHTYFGDEDGNAGSVVTFLEFEEAPPGVPGDGDIHRLILRVASYDSLEFWMDRFIANDVFSELLRLDPTQPQSIVFHDPEGHEVELMVSDTKDT